MKPDSMCQCMEYKKSRALSEVKGFVQGHRTSPSTKTCYSIAQICALILINPSQASSLKKTEQNIAFADWVG